VAEFTIPNLNFLSFSSQNCNSLNISTNCPKQTKKIAAILSLQTTIIFLSDIRLNTVTEDDYSNLFSPRYDFYHNSTSSRRGVGILISNSLQYSVSKKYCDENNNILGIKMVTNYVSILLIGVHGPNQNEEIFFRELKKIIMENSDSNQIKSNQIKSFIYPPAHTYRHIW
jgi:exonuclease III